MAATSATVRSQKKRGVAEEEEEEEKPTTDWINPPEPPPPAAARAPSPTSMDDAKFNQAPTGKVAATC